MYQFLLDFDTLYERMTDLEKKQFMRTFIESIELYPKKKEKHESMNRTENRPRQSMNFITCSRKIRCWRGNLMMSLYRHLTKKVRRLKGQSAHSRLPHKSVRLCSEKQCLHRARFHSTMLCGTILPDFALYENRPEGAMTVTRCSFGKTEWTLLKFQTEGY